MQRNKTRMIDDYSISGVNDTAASHNKVDLHMVDTFAAVLREFFKQCGEHSKASEIWAKTYDLKSAYRQVPIKEEHLQFSYFCIYNCELGAPEVYQLLTLPFGATHSWVSIVFFALPVSSTPLQQEACTCSPPTFTMITFWLPCLAVLSPQRMPWNWYSC